MLYLIKSWIIEIKYYIVLVFLSPKSMCTKLPLLSTKNPKELKKHTQIQCMWWLLLEEAVWCLEQLFRLMTDVLKHILYTHSSDEALCHRCFLLHAGISYQYSIRIAVLHLRDRVTSAQHTIVVWYPYCVSNTHYSCSHSLISSSGSSGLFTLQTVQSQHEIDPIYCDFFCLQCFWNNFHSFSFLFSSPCPLLFNPSSSYKDHFSPSNQIKRDTKFHFFSLTEYPIFHSGN